MYSSNNIIMSSVPFKLSATLAGHDQDVRGIAIPDNSTILSTSRDGTVRVWKAASEEHGWISTRTDGIILFSSPTQSFINSLASVKTDSESLVASAGQDTMIYLSDIYEFDPQDDTGKYQLIGHQANVCSLYHQGNELISGSWDTTAKVWDLNSFEIKHSLEGHQSSVWDAKILPDGKYITCSADRTIRIWDGKHEIAQYTGHSDVIRKLLVLPDGKFASASNDGTIKIWDLATGQVFQTLEGHSSFVYDVNILPNGDLVSTGEDRTVRVWRNGVCIQVITLPCISVWCVGVLESGDIAVGSSDNLVRVFTRTESRVAPQHELAEFRQAVENSSISEQSVDDLKKTDIPGYDALKTPGKQEGAILMVKNDAGVIEAHQWSGGEWIKIGDVVGSNASKEKKTFDGKEWDYVFDVDVEDGKPPLKLPYNSNENAYVAAERFLAANDLPSSYTDEVVRFINKNTEGVEIQQTSGPAPNPYADHHETKTPEPSASSASLQVIPEKTYITFKDYKPEILIKGLTKSNDQQAAEHQFSSEIVSQISSKLYTLQSKEALQIITEYIPQILNQWKPESRIIGYDLLRVCVTRVVAVDLLGSVEAAEVTLNAITNGLDVVTDATLPLLMLLLKTLNNLIENVLFIQLYVDPSEDGTKYQYNSFFQQLLKKLTNLIAELSSSAKASKHYVTTTTALATLAYNLSAFHLKTSGLNTNPGSSDPVVQFLAQIGETVVDNTEAAYRLLVAYGNFKYAKAANIEPSWIARALSIKETRFADIKSDITQL